MNEEKEINELATEIYTLFRSRPMSRALARRLYDKGWRKQNEATTVYERIKAMSLDEMVSFFVYLAEKQIIETADNYICRKCRAEHGGDCPCNDENCLYDLSPEATIRLWLEKEMTEGEDGTHEG